MRTHKDLIYVYEVLKKRFFLSTSRPRSCDHAILGKIIKKGI